MPILRRHSCLWTAPKVSISQQVFVLVTREFAYWHCSIRIFISLFASNAIKQVDKNNGTSNRKNTAVRFNVQATLMPFALQLYIVVAQNLILLHCLYKYLFKSRNIVILILAIQWNKSFGLLFFKFLNFYTNLDKYVC